MEVQLNRNKTPFIIKVNQMVDGSIGEIIEGTHSGSIVQRYGDSLIKIGQGFGYGWTGITGNTLSVRILEPGESIEIL